MKRGLTETSCLVALIVAGHPARPRVRSIGGGPTYDALIAAVARKADVDLLLTLNRGHFQRVAPDLIGRIREP